MKHSDTQLCPTTYITSVKVCFRYVQPFGSEDDIVSVVACLRPCTLYRYEGVRESGDLAVVGVQSIDYLFGKILVFVLPSYCKA